MIEERQGESEMYYINRTLDADFDDAIARVTEALGKEGFGILTEIDVQATLRKKLDVDFRRYRILGACNPPFAHKALQTEDKIGLMLPCNVIVQERQANQVEVAAIDPAAAMQGVGNSRLEPIAREVREKLERVIRSL
jgi:uncharacterized protein (DUF302 family)